MINIPQPLPDELANGFVARIGIVNGLASRKATIQLITEWLMANHRVASDQPLAVLLAAAVGTSQMEFIRNHTLLPLHRAITGYHADYSHGDPREKFILSISGLRLLRPTAHFCHDCIREDFSYWGFSYWRRSHQLPGTDWCPKHHTALWEVLKDAFNMLPKSVDANSASISADNLLDQDNAVIRRYLEILYGLIELHSPLSPIQTTWILSERARQLNIRTSINGNHPTLSDLALELLPGNWLKKHFPLFKSKKPGEFVHSFDGTCIFRSKNHISINFAMAAALLFPSADIALNALINHMPLNSKAPKEKRKLMRRSADYWTSIELLEAYAKHGGNCAKLAASIGGDYDQIRLNLIKNGLPPVHKASAKTLAAIKDFYDGVPLNEIITRPSIHLGKFYKLVRTGSPRFAKALALMN